MKVMLTDTLAELHQFILQIFVATGHSPTLSDVQEQFSLDNEEDAEKLLSDLEQTRAIHRNSGDTLVTHVYPFSNEPTAHRVTLASGVQVNSMCAVDALGIPFMLKTDALIDSECLQCQQAVHVNVKAGKIVDHAPNNLMVGYVPMGNCSTPATEQCPHINFFCSQEHLEAWAKEHPEHDLKFMNLEQALEQGERIFGSAMSGDACCSSS